MTHKVVLIPGDGIGPEVSEAMSQIVLASGAPVEFLPFLAGEAALLAGKNELLPAETLAAIRQHGVQTPILMLE